MDSDMDDAAYNGSVAKVNGNRYVSYLDRNDSNRNLNLNRRDDRWNRNCRFLAVRHSCWFSRQVTRREFCFVAVGANRRAFGQQPPNLRRDA